MFSFVDRFLGRVGAGSRWLEAADVFVTPYPNLEDRSFPAHWRTPWARASHCRSHPPAYAASARDAARRRRVGGIPVAAWIIHRPRRRPSSRSLRDAERRASSWERERTAHSRAMILAGGWGTSYLVASSPGSPCGLPGQRPGKPLSGSPLAVDRVSDRAPLPIQSPGHILKRSLGRDRDHPACNWAALPRSHSEGYCTDDVARALLVDLLHAT